MGVHFNFSLALFSPSIIPFSEGNEPSYESHGTSQVTEKLLVLKNRTTYVVRVPAHLPVSYLPLLRVLSVTSLRKHVIF